MKRSTYIHQFTSLNRKYEEKFYPHVKRAIHAKVKTVQRRLKSGGVSNAIAYLNSDLANEKMAEVMRKMYRIVGSKHAQLNYSRLLPERMKRKGAAPVIQEKGFGKNQQWINFINRYLERHLLDKITFSINSTTRDALLAALSLMMDEGLSTDLMIERLDNWDKERYQAARIVRTEVNRAANTGVTAQAETDEFQQVKEWIAIHDNRTRGNPQTGQKDHANHWALDRVTIDEKDVFIDPRNGDRLQFPGDPNASAASTVNCRCSIAMTYKRDQNGDLIPKRRSTTVIYPGQIPRNRPVITI